MEHNSEATHNPAYVGWVPCLNGQLVFNLVECGLKTEPGISIVHYAINKNQLAEYILLHSMVDWKDFDDDEGKSNGLWSVFLLSTRHESDNTHQGCLFFMLNQGKKEESYYKPLKTLQTINYSLNTDQTIDIPNKFKSLKDNLYQTSAAGEHCFYVDFKLNSDGIVLLRPETLNNENEQQIIARQAYYYIKYAWHRHQHHDARAETLTTIHRWVTKAYIANALISDIKTNLVSFKREIDITSHRDILKAKGIITYAKALVEILKARKFIDENRYNREINHLRYFQESLDISHTGIHNDMLLHNSTVNDARAGILFLLAIMTPALLTNQHTQTPPSYIQWVSGWFVSGTGFGSLMLVIGIFLLSYILVNSHFGNMTILWYAFKKSVAIIVNDKEQRIGTMLLTIIIILMGAALIGFSIYTLGVYVSALA